MSENENKNHLNGTRKKFLFVSFESLGGDLA